MLGSARSIEACGGLCRGRLGWGLVGCLGEGCVYGAIGEGLGLREGQRDGHGGRETYQ